MNYRLIMFIAIALFAGESMAAELTWTGRYRETFIDSSHRESSNALGYFESTSTLTVGQPADANYGDYVAFHASTMDAAGVSLTASLSAVQQGTVSRSARSAIDSTFTVNEPSQWRLAGIGTLDSEFGGVNISIAEIGVGTIAGQHGVNGGVTVDQTVWLQPGKMYAATFKLVQATNANFDGSLTATLTQVPEPTTAMFAVTLVGFALMRCRHDAAT